MKKTAESYLTFYSSVDFYSTGQFEKAREGFVKVSSSNLVPPSMKKASEVYLTQINQMTEEFETPTADPKVEPVVTPAPVVPPVTGQSSDIMDAFKSRRNIIRSHTRAVVTDAVAKARNYINQGSFDKAKNVVETAALTVNTNQMHLGDKLFKEYTGLLEALTEEIVERENEEIRQAEQEKREAATGAQRRYREQMEMDREKEIADLMENALTYQKQQRYEAALGQLVSLLALDPQNEQALVLKDTLEDMIYFRKQLEVTRESDKQRADVLLKTEESGIPYAEELTYPKYWRELIDKPTRQPDKPIGLSEADARVYEQLERPIDLSDLTPSMTFGEVIERLKNSVEPPIQIQPNWRDLLENAEVDPALGAGMDPLTGVTLRKALEILLAGVSSIDFAELIYVVDEGVILVGTVDMLERPMVNRVYDISDLVAEPANFRGMGGMMGGMGGGMMGGMGGMGGYGGGGMGGYGGGMGGMGMMGGMGGGGMGRFIAEDLRYLIQETSEPDEWFETSDTG